MARGVDPVEARRRARLELGGPEQIKEATRDARGTLWLEDFLRDLRHSARMLLQKPGFTAMVACTLALGIGASTLMFTIFNGVLLRPFPYRGAERLLAGRFFNAQDHLGSQLVVVIDEVLTQRAFGNEPALSKQLWIPTMAQEPVLVVGVVAHVRHWGVATDDQSQVRAQVYYPLAQVPDALMRRWSEVMSVAVRTTGDPLSMVEPLRQAIRGAANDQVLYEFRTMDQLAASTLARHNFLMLLFAVFSGLALLLASLGIYGVIAYLTRLRTPDFGIRIALGATAADIINLLLRQGLAMFAAGITTGLIGAYIAGRLIERSLAGVESAQPLTFAVMTGVLAAAAFAACLIPARRAARIDPSGALRTD